MWKKPAFRCQWVWITRSDWSVPWESYELRTSYCQGIYLYSCTVEIGRYINYTLRIRLFMSRAYLIYSRNEHIELSTVF